MNNKPSFVSLHTHSHGSILDGFSTVDDLIKRVVELGQPGLAITDHGTLFTSYELYKKAKAEGIQPIIGIEAYVAPSHLKHTDHLPGYFADGGSDDVSSKGAYTHMLLFAKNNEGLKALFKLSELSYTEGYYRKPRMSVELFKQYANGNLVATTGCPSGELQTKLRLGLFDQAVEYARMMQEIFGKENYYMELMNHNMSIDLERKVESDLLKIAEMLDIPLLATADSHYTNKEDAEAHEHLLCISTRSKMSVPTSNAEGEGGKTRFAFDGQGYYLHSAEEMLALFPEDKYPGAVTNTVKVMEQCSNVIIEPRDDIRPKIDIPDGLTEGEYLRREVFDGLAKRLPEKINDPEYIARLEEELDVIISKNYSGYFLVVSDFVRWAKNNDIPVGPGRGCLTADTRVLTSEGFKGIADIKIGDKVYNKNGELETVSDTFVYDCDEELLQIKSYYGGAGNTMTADHKVLISRAALTGNSHPSKKKYSDEISSPEWIPASEVKLGDLVVLPKTSYPVNTFSFKVNPEHVAPTNLAYEHNMRAIAASVGVSRATVKKFFQNATEKLTPGQQKVEKYLLDNELDVKTEIARRTKRDTLAVSEIEANYDLGWLLGVFISDGWIRKDRISQVGFAQRTSEDEGQITAVFKKIFGVELNSRNSTISDVTQYTYEHKGIGEFFKNLFAEYDYTAQTKYIPRALMETSEEFRKGLLEGLWYGDGSHKGKSKYATVSSKLAEGVAELLLSLGLPAGIKTSYRKEERPEWNKKNKPARAEYNVVTSHNFDNTLITANVGKGYDGEYSYYRVREINKVASPGKVYDFTMPDTHSYVTDSYVVHNSAAGSLLAYCLDITDAEPIRFGLLFSRFLNPERESPPDIDMDFNDEDREKVIEYVKQKYGHDQVAQVVTFGKILAKNAVKDTVRILDEPYALGDELTKAMPEPIFGKSMPLKYMLEPGSPRYDEAEDFRKLVKEREAEHVIRIAKQLEGRIRSTGVHAAALVVSSEPIVNNIPMMMRQNDSAYITQWDYPTAEELGLLKFDFLGLRNLGIIKKAIENIKQTKNVTINLQDLINGPMDDDATYKLLQAGNTLGVFQLDSGGLRSLLKLLKPTSFEDISAVLSLYRPGPMGVNAHNDYALRKNGLQEVDYIAPELETILKPILKPTYGLVIYQEQVQLIARDLAGYSLGRADDLRRAMGKKKKEILDKEWEPFLAGALERGYSPEAVKTLWEVLVPFADYAFNKSHTVAYGLISYITAFLKANYAAEYMSALLSSVADDTDKTALYLEDCRVNGIHVLPPDVSKSMVDYYPLSDSEILFGLKAIRGVGQATSEQIVEARIDEVSGEVVSFKDFNDFVYRVSKDVVNKRVLEGLTFGGAFDGLGVSRRAIVHQLPELLKQYQRAAKSKSSNQVSLFDLDDVVEYRVLPMDEYPKMEKLKLERQALGLYISGHPIDGLNIANMSSARVASVLDGSVKALEGWPSPRDVPIRLAGIVTSLMVKRTKKGEMFAIAKLEDRSGAIECAIFPKTYAKVGEFLKLDGVYQFVGFARKRDEELSFVVDNVRPLEFSSSGNLSVRLKLTEAQFTKGRDMLESCLRRHLAPVGEPGDDVIVSLKNPDGDVREVVLDLKVRRSPALLQEVQEIFGSLSIGRWLRSKPVSVDEVLEDGS